MTNVYTHKDKRNEEWLTQVSYWIQEAFFVARSKYKKRADKKHPLGKVITLETSAHFLALLDCSLVPLYSGTAMAADSLLFSNTWSFTSHKFPQMFLLFDYRISSSHVSSVCLNLQSFCRVGLIPQKTNYTTTSLLCSF